MNKLFLILLLVVISSSVFAQRSVFTPRQYSVIDSLIDAAVFDSTQVNANFDSIYTYWMNIHEAQTITGQKNFSGLVNFPDSNKTLMTITNPNAAAYGDFHLQVRNFNVNADGIPDVVMRLGHNIAQGGGQVNGDYGAFALEWESHYISNGQVGHEFHLAHVDIDGNVRRPVTVFSNDSTGAQLVGFSSNNLQFNTDAGTLYAQIINGANCYFQNPFNFIFSNNSTGLGWWNADTSAALYAPYFDSQNRYNLGNVAIMKAPSTILTLDTTYLRLSDIYGIKSYDGDNNSFDIMYYDSDKLRIKAYPLDPIYFTGSHLFYEDGNGATTDIVNPVLPLDTTGVAIGRRYIDPNSGNVKQVMGADIVLNGDFTDWTGYGKTGDPDNWVVSWEDTTSNYVEQSPAGVLHYVFVDSTHQDSTLTIYQTGATVGRSYGYSFRIDSVNGLIAIAIAGKGWNQNGVVSAGVYTGVVDSAVSTQLFGMIRQDANTPSDIYVDDVKVWDMNGEKQIPIDIHREAYVNNWALPSLLDTLSIFLTDKLLTVDSIKFRVDDSCGVKGTFGALGLGTTLFGADTLFTPGWHTIDTFIDNTVDANKEVYFYFTYIGDALTYIRWKIYWRE